MAAVNLDALTTAITNQTTVDDSAIALIQGLADQLREIPATQAAINDLASQLDAKRQALVDAITANTPSA